ncbi:hypothetical protein [Tropicimonas sp. S265A]|uniref:hypothetical protein n=1 Tax=Tropicimonas sp. S265A TaxID=3415134 RepID=UPI003C7BABD1
MLVPAMKLASVLLWSYAIVLVVFWVRAVAAQDRKSHVGHFIELLACLVPLSCALVAMVMVGAVIGIPSVVGFLFILLPAGVVVALSLEVRRVEGASDTLESWRLGLALCLAIGVIAGRGGI